MISEFIISGTLLINAVAILNVKFNKSSQPSFIADDQITSGSFSDKLKEFVESVQYFRVFIALWNFLIIFLMLT